MNTTHIYDVIIVGGSYSGLAAAMALGRAMRRVLVIDSGLPCNRQTPFSHNFITHDGKTPKQIHHEAKLQVEKYPTVSFYNGLANTALKLKDGFEVRTSTSESFTAKKLIFATGIQDILPDIEGFKASWGISALHCPYCHGYEVRHQATGILANGDAGYEFSSLISHWTKDLVLLTNGQSTLSAAQSQKLLAKNIPIRESKVQGIVHKNGYLQSVRFEDGTQLPLTTLYAKLPFRQHCPLPEQLGCELSAEGYLKIDTTGKTTVDGVYACGDNTSRMRTVANAVAMGTAAGMMVNKTLIEETF